MVRACIDMRVAEHLHTAMPTDVSAVIDTGSRHLSQWEFTCTSEQALILRAELCAAAIPKRDSAPELSDQLLRAERAIAQAMIG